MEKIIDNYAHDYRYITMSEDQLKIMLINFLIEYEEERIKELKSKVE